MNVQKIRDLILLGRVRNFLQDRIGFFERLRGRAKSEIVFDYANRAMNDLFPYVQIVNVKIQELTEVQK